MSRFFRNLDESSSESSSDSEDERASTTPSASLGKLPVADKRRPRHRGPSAEDDSEPSEIDRSNAPWATQSAQSLSADISIALPQQDENQNFNLRDAGQHQEMLLATLLEEHYRNRAADFLNRANPGSTYTRHSPEVQPLARQLYSQASSMLQSAGLLKVGSSSDALRDARTQYLAGLDQLGAGASEASLIATMRQLNIHSHPASDQSVMSYAPPRPRSHYQNSFREVCLLGRGGFGRVFKCHNLLDQKTYAVKRIPLSPRLSRSFSEGRHEELQHVLLEVQTLASLDHTNIVRYHATWVEEPQTQTPPVGSSSVFRPGFGSGRPASGGRQLLIENTSDAASEMGFSAEQAKSVSCGFVFAEDSRPSQEPANNQRLLTSETRSEDTEGTISEEESANASDIFTDGTHSYRPLVERDKNRTEPEPAHTHELFIQMSLYPLTLFQYLSSSPDASHPRHCYHLVPSLQILLAILSGLRYLWSRRLVHRDVKPRNIFLSAPEHEPLMGYCDVSCHHACHGDRPRWLNPRIGDFGLVTRLAHGELPEGHGGLGKVVGTPLYRPPACAWDGSDHGPRIGVTSDSEKVDVFALGVVFVELLCPFSTVMERADALSGLQKAVLPSRLRGRLEKEGFGSAVADQVLKVVRGMVDPDPESRWSGERIAEAVERIKAEVEATTTFGD